MYCRNCGKEIEENAKFCSNCGTNSTGEIFSFNYEKTSELPPTSSSYFYGGGAKFWFIINIVALALQFIDCAAVLLSDNSFIKFAVSALSFTVGKWALPFAAAECLIGCYLFYALLTKKARKYFYALCVMKAIDLLLGCFLLISSGFLVSLSASLPDIIAVLANPIITYLVLRKYWDDMD